MEKDDDEISIDFSKIKNIFKKKKEETSSDPNNSPDKKPESNEETKQEPPKKDDDEINIDFGKIKDVFKKVKSAVSEEEKPEIIEKKEDHSKSDTETRETKIEDVKKDDDEIAIDFSKIKNIFKKKAASEEKSETKDDDEISIDFSKLKNIKNIFKKSSEPKESDDDVSIDFKKISNFFVKNRVFLLLLIPIILSIFLRIQPAYLPITDQWAVDTVTNNIRNEIKGQVNQQYPNLPDQNKDILVENEFQKLLQQQKPQIDQQVQATSNFFKSKLQDDTGQTYLIAIDPYFWMRHAKNIVENGHPGDELKNGRPWDTHMFAPLGREPPPDMFHAYFEAFLFKFLSLFNNNLNLMKVAFYIPVIISALSVIPAFFIAKRIAGNFAGFIAGTIVAIHPSFLTRTVGGFSDTDAYNVMFPLFITWLFIEALEAKNMKNTTILSAIAGLLIAFYSVTWGGWWYIFDFILASTFFYLAYYAFVHKKELIQNFSNFRKQKAIKNSLTFLAIFSIVTLLSTSLFVSYGHFTKFYKYPTGFVKLKEVGITTIWPNVFTTVAEQNPASLDNVINQVGLGKFFFFLIALMGITLTLTRRNDKKLWFVGGTLAWYLLIFFLKIQDLNTFLILISIPIAIRVAIALWQSDTEIDIKYAILLILWFIATTFASTKGVRFTLLLVPAFAIGFGIAFGWFYRYANVWITKLLQINKLVSKTTVIIVLLLLLVAPYKSAAGIAKNEIPSFNDAWANSLDKIKADSKPNAIINSWWDFGHWFKYWADRPVTFDGTSQNTPPAHWIGKVLLTDDEDLAVGILRMLDCSSREGFTTISELTKDGTEAIHIMYEIMPHNKKEAKKILDAYFDDKDSEKILEKTHCEPPENYFITSEDMVGKSGVWGHFGSWDFDRALIYNTLKKEEYEKDIDKSTQFLKERFEFSHEEAENLYYEILAITDSGQANNWIAPWPGYAGSVGCSRDEDMLTCSNGFRIDLKNKEAFAESPEGRVYPKKISFPTNEGIIVKEYNESVINLQNGRSLGFALIQKGENYELLQMDSDLTASMFTRLFYQEGIGLKYFKKFSEENSVVATFNGRKIIVWKIDWEGNETTIIKVPEPEIEDKIVEDELESNITNTEKDLQDIDNETNATDSENDNVEIDNETTINETKETENTTQQPDKEANSS
jgi:dolichyl-diphosphooligosaccharide--protein glycosyltransferase